METEVSACLGRSLIRTPNGRAERITRMSHTRITMYGTLWCSDCKRTKQFLDNFPGLPEGVSGAELAGRPRRRGEDERS